MSSTGRRKGLFLAAAVATVSWLIASVGARAQTTAATFSAAAAEEGPQLQEVTVTAQRREESSQKVPITVNAFSTKDLERLSVAEPKDLQYVTPGLTFPQDDAILQPYIRGRGTGYTGIGLEGSIPVYIDDAYLEDNYSVASLIDVGQVQVLKGPQGTLYGRNSTGGAILITTNNPTHDSEGYLQAGYGNLQNGNLRAVVNIPVTDTLALRFAGGYEYREGYVRNVVDDEKQGGLKRWTVRMKALWTPTEELSALFKFEYHFGQQGFLRQLLLEGTGTPTGLGFYDTQQSPQNPLALGGENREHDWTTSLNLQYKTDHGSLANVATYRGMDLTSCADDDFVYPQILNFCYGAVPVGTPYLPGGTPKSFDKTWSDSLRFTSNLAMPFNFMVGFDYQNTYAHFPAVLTGSAFAPNTPAYSNYIELSSYAIFAELYYQITDQLKLTVGGRGNRDEKTLRGINGPFVGSDFGLPPGLVPSSFGQKDAFDDFTPRAVLSYDMGDANYYVSFNKGFKSGGFNVPTFLPTQPLKAEKTAGYEIGSKMKLFNGRAHFDVAGFYTKSTDVQVTLVNTQTGSVIEENAASVKGYGVEGTFTVAATDRLTLAVGSSYLHSRFTDFANASVYALSNGVLASTAEDLSGFPTPNSPDYTGTFSGSYTLPLAGGWSTDYTLSGRYSSQYDFTAGAGGPLREDRQGGFATFDLTGRIVTPGEKLTLSWYVDNLGGRKYYDIINTNAGFGAYGVAALPRTYGASLRYNF